MKWYKYNIENLTDTEYLRWYSLMSEYKKHRVDRFRFIDDKKRTVTGEMLARKAISERCGVTPESIIFDIKSYGKPYAKDLPVEFNISHSGDMVVCAVNNNPIGIDIERIRPINMNITKRIYTDEELLYLFGHSPTDDDFLYTTDVKMLTRFFELWTTKEAYIKYLGTGISNSLNCINALSFPANRYYLNDQYVISILST